MDYPFPFWCPRPLLPDDASFVDYEFCFASEPDETTRIKIAVAFHEATVGAVGYQTGPAWRWAASWGLVRLANDGKGMLRRDRFFDAVAAGARAVHRVAPLVLARFVAWPLDAQTHDPSDRWAAWTVDHHSPVPGPGWAEGLAPIDGVARFDAEPVDDDAVEAALRQRDQELQAAVERARSDRLEGGGLYVEQCLGDVPKTDRAVSAQALAALGNYGWAARGADDFAFGLEYQPRGRAYAYRVWALRGESKRETSQKLDAATFRYAFAPDERSVLLYPRRFAKDRTDAFRDLKKPVLYCLDLESGEVRTLLRRALIGHGATSEGFVAATRDRLELFRDGESTPMVSLASAELREIHVSHGGRIVTIKGPPTYDLAFLGVHRDGFSLLGVCARYDATPVWQGGFSEVDDVLYIECDEDDAPADYVAVHHLISAWKKADTDASRLETLELQAYDAIEVRQL
ncbi:MAG: hypothetical protein AAGF12_18430 [Myxococcota bacterium]